MTGAERVYFKKISPNSKIFKKVLDGGEGCPYIERTERKLGSLFDIVNKKLTQSFSITFAGLLLHKLNKKTRET